MSVRKIISTFAKSDLSEASKWYEKQQKGLGKRYLNEMKMAFDIICKNPESFTVRYDDYRIFFTKTFPYGIHYQYIASKKEIHIKAIFHAARNPHIWEQRTLLI